MRRSPHLSSQYFPRGAGWQISRMVAMLVVVVLVFSWTREPRNWQWLSMLGAQTTDDQSSPPPVVPPPQAEAVSPATNDTDPKEMDEARKQFEALDDNKKLAPAEMPAYWHLMRWARSGKFSDLEKRAAQNVRFAQIWEEPSKYRGQLMRLKVHIRRIKSHPAPENSAGAKTVYEAWGWTDDSKSFPWVLVFSELPPGLQTGDTVFEDGIFVGYFLKMLWYANAEGKQQTAPLLVGSMAYIPQPKVASAPSVGWGTVATFAVGIIAVLAVVVVASYRATTRRRKPLVAPSAVGEDQIEDWLKEQSASAAASSHSDDESVRR